jgi:hypothetical protein
MFLNDEMGKQKFYRLSSQKNTWQLRLENFFDVHAKNLDLLIFPGKNRPL